MTDSDTDTRTSAERMLDEIDPSNLQWRDASHLRAIMRANENLDAAASALHAAVLAARSAGDSWVAIGAALGVTKQAAQKRFGGESAPAAERPPGAAKQARRRRSPTTGRYVTKAAAQKAGQMAVAAKQVEREAALAESKARRVPVGRTRKTTRG